MFTLTLDFSAASLAAIHDLADAIRSRSPHAPRAVIGQLTVDHHTITGEIMSFQLADDKTAHASVVFKDARGNVTTAQNPVWASSDPAVFTVAPSADGFSVTVTPAGPLGTAQLQFSADADLGAGVKSITGTADVEIVAGEAATAEISLIVNP